jgi:hypothetical protein
MPAPGSSPGCRPWVARRDRARHSQADRRCGDVVPDPQAASETAAGGAVAGDRMAGVVVSAAAGPVSLNGSSLLGPAAGGDTG